MGLHSILPDSEIPDVLKRQLVFGDAEQIAALQVVGLRIAKYEERAKKKGDGLLKKYEVDIEFVDRESYFVLAENKVEAKELALEEAAEDCYGGEAEVISCREVEVPNPALKSG